MMRGKHCSAAIAVAGILAALVLGACGGDDDSNGSGGSSTSNAGESTPKVKVGISTPSTDIIALIADGKGFFDEAGVDVDVQTATAANTPTLVSSGQLDLGGYSATAPVQTNLAGGRAAVVYALAGGAIGGVVVVAPDGPDSIEDAKNMDDCRLGAFPQGTSSYGYAALYNERLGLGCDIVPFQDPPAILGALASGRIDFAVSGYTNFATAINAGKAKLILDTRDPDVREKYSGEPVPEVAYFGSRPTLEKNKEGITRFLQGYAKARAFAEDPANEAEVIEVLKKVPDLSTFSDEEIKRDVLDTFLAYANATGGKDGLIDKPLWDAALQRYSEWDVPKFDADAKAASFEDSVDMSYNDAALAQK